MLVFHGRPEKLFSLSLLSREETAERNQRGEGGGVEETEWNGFLIHTHSALFSFVSFMAYLPRSVGTICCFIVGTFISLLMFSVLSVLSSASS